MIRGDRSIFPNCNSLGFLFSQESPRKSNHVNWIDLHKTFGIFSFGVVEAGSRRLVCVHSLQCSHAACALCSFVRVCSMSHPLLTRNHSIIRCEAYVCKAVQRQKSLALNFYTPSRIIILSDQRVKYSIRNVFGWLRRRMQMRTPHTHTRYTHIPVYRDTDIRQWNSTRSWQHIRVEMLYNFHTPNRQQSLRMNV